MQDIRERGRDKGEKLKVLIVTIKCGAGGMSGKEERESEARRRYGEE